jgi:hypothetical protein
LFEKTLFRSKSETYLDEIVFDEKRFQYVIPTKPPRAAIIPTQTIHPVQNPPRVMATRFVPLALPSQLHDFPQNYNQRIKLYDAEGNASSQNHLDWFNYFVGLEEVNHEDVKMRLFMHRVSQGRSESGLRPFKRRASLILHHLKHHFLPDGAIK